MKLKKNDPDLNTLIFAIGLSGSKSGWEKQRENIRDESFEKGTLNVCCGDSLKQVDYSQVSLYSSCITKLKPSLRLEKLVLRIKT